MTDRISFPDLYSGPWTIPLPSLTTLEISSSLTIGYRQVFLLLNFLSTFPPPLLGTLNLLVFFFYHVVGFIKYIVWAQKPRI